MTDDLVVTKYLSNPQELAQHIRQTRDFDIGLKFCQVVKELKERIDSTLDPVILAMQEVFEQDKPSEYKGMTFFEAMRYSSLDSSTIERHMRVGKTLPIIPDNVRSNFEMMPFRSKIQIANAVEEGYDLTEKNEKTGKMRFEELADAYYPQEVSLKLHEIKGTQPRSQFCKWEVDEDGNLIVRTAFGEFMAYKPVRYDNPETEEHMDWVRKKTIRKLGATPK